ncbi:hypothetical protein ILUMI_15701 [Ignelater luminosus]|uniref:Uncharacterized protein n=1 Tax=Ignelater luminosus TaxID=2038154 RepID=A0A8K0G6M0_IGNLU|nr:hypothetical protein ILUMI_15701 [Ignelater luminosus]
MTGPFVVSEYIDILEPTVNYLGLNDKPELIWDLTRRPSRMTPVRQKLFGAKGKPSFRTTNGSGRENTTVVWCASFGDDLICIGSDEGCNPEMYEEDNEDRQQEVAPDKW